MAFNYKNVLIYGYSSSGKAVEQVLIANQINHKIYDDNLRLNGGKYLKKLTPKILAEFDLMVISPGISIYNKNIILAEKLGVKVVSELEFGYWFCKFAIIAVTGTNGKTTTVHLINNLLNNAGLKSDVFGNVGRPLSEIAFVENLDYAVVEVSSFQLEATDKFCAKIGIILNIDQDHIDRHKTIENYAMAKVNLFKNANENNIAILNYDDQNLSKFLNKINAKKVFFSKVEEVNGVYLKNQKVVVNYKNSKDDLTNLNEIDLTKTYLENIFATYLVLKELNISKEVFLKTINEYKPLKCRLEVIDEIKGVKYINDSKATNIHATSNALKSFSSNVILLLGGVNKNLNFKPFFKELPTCVKSIILFGKARNKIYRIAKKCKLPVYVTSKMEFAVYAANAISNPNDIVLLSPACASFDEYKNYQQRGEHFEKIVNALKNLDENKIFKNNKIYNLKSYFKKGKKFKLLKRDLENLEVNLDFIGSKKFKKYLLPKNKFEG